MMNYASTIRSEFEWLIYGFGIIWAQTPNTKRKEKSIILDAWKMKILSRLLLLLPGLYKHLDSTEKHSQKKNTWNTARDEEIISFL